MSKAWINLKSWFIVFKCQLRARQLFSILKVSVFILIFRLSTNSIDHNDETGHFVKHILLVLILKVNVKKEI